MRAWQGTPDILREKKIKFAANSQELGLPKTNKSLYGANLWENNSQNQNKIQSGGEGKTHSSPEYVRQFSVIFVYLVPGMSFPVKPIFRQSLRDSTEIEFR